MDFVFKTMDFVFKMIGFVFKMMINREVCERLLVTTGW